MVWLNKRFRLKKAATANAVMYSLSTGMRAEVYFIVDMTGELANYRISGHGVSDESRLLDAKEKAIELLKAHDLYNAQQKGFNHG